MCYTGGETLEFVRTCDTSRVVIYGWQVVNQAPENLSDGLAAALSQTGWFINFVYHSFILNIFYEIDEGEFLSKLSSAMPLSLSKPLQTGLELCCRTMLRELWDSSLDSKILGYLAM